MINPVTQTQPHIHNLEGAEKTSKAKFMPRSHARKLKMETTPEGNTMVEMFATHRELSFFISKKTGVEEMLATQ